MTIVQTATDLPPVHGAAAPAGPHAGSVTTAADDAARRAIVDSCQSAFRLGWHVAEIATGAYRQMWEEDIWDRLTASGPSSDPLAAVLKLIEADATRLITSAVPPALTDQPSDTEVFAYHLLIVGALAAVDYRVVKAYLVGVGLRRVTAIADPSDPLLVDASVLSVLTGRIKDLKSCFQPHASDAVAATLSDWGKAMEGKGEFDDWARRLRVQGQLWRALLSGEKLATDTIQVPDYIEAAKHVAAEFYGFAVRIVRTGPVALFVLIVSGLAVAGGFYAVVNKNSVGISAAIVALLAVFGVTSASATATAKRALSQGEGALWEAELAAAIAVAISQVPVELPRRHSSVAKLRTRASLARASAQPAPTSTLRGSPEFTGAPDRLDLVVSETPRSAQRSSSAKPSGRDRTVE
jgi:hypothetical protein